MPLIIGLLTFVAFGLLSLDASLCSAQVGNESSIVVRSCALKCQLTPKKTQNTREMHNPKDGATLVLIPKGDFWMGDRDDVYNPRRKVWLSAFSIYKDLVSVKQYREFCRQSGHLMPSSPFYDEDWSGETLPICNVTWEDAMAYANWAGGTLPTEAQWEKAARGTNGRRFPWGDDFDCSKVWGSHVISVGKTTPVGRYAISPYGLTDMSGNVWQWCLDWYERDYWKDARGKRKDPVNLVVRRKVIPRFVDGVSGSHVLKGGDWRTRDNRYFRCANRYYIPDWDILSCGFRVLLVPKQTMNGSVSLSVDNCYTSDNTGLQHK